jgi:hypothetical protein
VKLYLLGYQDILAGHLCSNSKRKANCKKLESSGSKPSGGRDVAEMGSAVVRCVSRLFYAFPVFLDFGRGRCRLVVCSSPPHLFSIILHAQYGGDKNISRIYIGKIAQLVEYFFIKGESTLLNNSNN